jgi:hypothetical protein
MNNFEDFENLNKKEPEQIELEKIILGLSRDLPMDFIKQLETKIEYRKTLNRMILDLYTYVMGLRDKNFQYYKKFPRDWKQAVKERFAPKWFLKRWPVEYEEISINERIYKKVCPHLYTDRREEHLKFMAFEKEKI